MEHISRLLGSLQLLLRYMASGIVAMAVAALISPKVQLWLKDVDTTRLFVLLGLTAIAGLCIYAVHAQIINRVFLLYNANVFLHKNANQQGILAKHGWLATHDYDFSEGIGQAMTAIDLSRWFRRGSNCPVVKGFQREMDTWGTLMNFVYCTAYACLGVPALLWWIGWATESVLGPVTIGVLLFLGVFATDCRYVSLEFWAMSQFSVSHCTEQTGQNPACQAGCPNVAVSAPPTGGSEAGPDNNTHTNDTPNPPTEQ